MPDAPHPLDDRLGPDRLQSLLLDITSVDTVLSELAHLATQVVGPTSCGITVRYDGQLLTVGSSDERAELLDETQYRKQQGPCLEALETSSIVELLDTERERRWPAYLPTAIEAGLRCSISVPLHANPAPDLGARAGAAGSSTSSATDERTAFGAVNVYGFDRARMFGEPERHQLELFAARIASTLQVARRLTRDSALLAQMDEALNSRSVIDQALGIIMGQQRCTATTAFQLLRRESQNSRRRLRDVAGDLVGRTTGRPPEPGRGFDAT